MSKWPNQPWAYSQNGPNYNMPSQPMPQILHQPNGPDVPHIASIAANEPKSLGKNQFGTSGYENSAVSPTAPSAGLVDSMETPNGAENGHPGNHYGPPVPNVAPHPAQGPHPVPGPGQLPGPMLGMPQGPYGGNLGGQPFTGGPSNDFSNYNYQIQGDQWSQMNIRPGIANSNEQGDYPKKTSSVSSADSHSSKERETKAVRKDSASKIAKRSRMGCLTCRQRKKRCCETRPECKECSRLRLKCVWPKPGMEHKNKPKELKLMENTIDHDIYGPIKVLRGIVEYRSDAD